MTDTAPETLFQLLLCSSTSDNRRCRINGYCDQCRRNESEIRAGGCCRARDSNRDRPSRSARRNSYGKTARGRRGSSCSGSAELNRIRAGCCIGA